MNPNIAAKPIVNAMTIDVEDYFQVSAMEPYIKKCDWEKWPCFVEQNTLQLLTLLEEKKVKATFFILGWVAERYPSLIKKIAAQGHEVGCHGWDHTRVYQQSPQAFRADIKKSKDILEQTIGASVLGYRAASYSIVQSNLWALEELQNAGFVYSSSIYPVARDLYGIPHAPKHPFRPAHAAQLIEVPVTTAQFGQRNVPAGGGGFFRLYPYFISKALIERVNHRARLPAIFYLHPWEIDPAQPSPKGINLKTRVRHYLNLSRTYSRLSRLLSDFSWGRMDEIFLHLDAPVVDIVNRQS